MTTTTDWLDRTPEQVEAGLARGRENRRRILARDWHELPKGYYAIPVRDYLAVSDEVGNDENARVPKVIGYQLFQRKVARTYRTGRVVGREAFITGRVMVVEGADPDAVQAEIKSDREAAQDWLGVRDGGTRDAVDTLMCDIEDGDTYRALYGRLTGRCGCCGRALTDPKSKLLGIGPECRGYR